MTLPLWGQGGFEFDGQLSLFGNYSPQNDYDVFLGGRYIPEVSYGIQLDSTKLLDFEASANIYGSVLTVPFDTAYWDGHVRPYRAWARYGSEQFEFRLGLQKIDFGSAMLLRPIQWFNQLDPRDPLGLTNGVYGALGRYYFLNNANVWAWVLYGNEQQRGFDFLESNWKLPEAGARGQLPLRQGEIALSYHYRTAQSTEIPCLPAFDRIPEHRLGIDGKWDMEIGFWFEAAVVRASKDLGLLTNQSLFNVGMDYSFGLGNGLNVVLEHLSVGSDDRFLGFANSAHITGSVLSYPFGLFDSLSGFLLYNWTTKDVTASLNYQHQFKKITGYIIAYYNPSITSGFLQNDLINQFSGPGFRLMVVYNH
jgi:hypothetical protein